MCIIKFKKNEIFHDLSVHEKQSPGKFQQFLAAYLLMDLLFFPSFFLNFGGVYCIQLCIIHTTLWYGRNIIIIVIKTKKNCWLCYFEHSLLDYL